MRHFCIRLCLIGMGAAAAILLASCRTDKDFKYRLSQKRLEYISMFIISSDHNKLQRVNNAQELIEVLMEKSVTQEREQYLALERDGWDVPFQILRSEMGNYVILRIYSESVNAKLAHDLYVEIKINKRSNNDGFELSSITKSWNDK